MIAKLIPPLSKSCPGGRKTSRWPGCPDILVPDGMPYPGDPRYVLKRMPPRQPKGFTYYAGIKFFILPHERPDIIDWPAISIPPPDKGADLRRETILPWRKWASVLHHEVADSQHEIDLRHDEGLKMADKTMTYRVAVRKSPVSMDLATFMPKPIFGINGSGMHTHQSLFLGSKNSFYDPKDQYHLSATAKSYIAGILNHAREITGVCNQWVNSYKRLVPGYEAPVYIAWARRNRSALVRVPKPAVKAPRTEYRP
jgi:glutamine synthetase